MKRLQKKVLSVLICFTVGMSFQTSSFAASIPEDSSSMTSKMPYTSLFDPTTGKNLPVKNFMNKAAEISARNPVSAEEKSAFQKYHNKLVMNKVFHNKRTSLTPKSALSCINSTSLPEQPIPGGFGAGITFTDSFKHNFTNGTRISYDIICPKTAGGNNSTWLFLTSTNRADFGVEALCDYYGQNDFCFQVYDWADSRGYVVTIPYEDLMSEGLIRTKTIDGKSYPFITVQSVTELVSGNTWRNIVWLSGNGFFVQVYYYEYTSSAALQQNGGNSSHWWGPIVETFQDTYSGTNSMGYDNTYLMSSDANSVWGNWVSLNTSNSYLSYHQGLHSIYTKPNSSWIVNSQ